MEKRKVEIDVKGKVLGRVATQIANILRGKDQASFRPDKPADVEVVVKNADLVAVTGNKTVQKNYYHFSGYPGGLKKESFKKLSERKPKDIIRLAVSRMLPKNRWRQKLLKRLVIKLSNEE